MAWHGTARQVDVAGHLVQAEIQAREDLDRMHTLFVEWMGRYVKDAEYVNLGSTTQMQQLFFGHYKDKVSSGTVECVLFVEIGMVGVECIVMAWHFH